MRINKVIREFLLNVVASGVVCHRHVRNTIYRWHGVELSQGCEVKAGCYIGDRIGALKIGGSTFVNYNCWFDLGDDITIGDNCNIAMNVTFLNSTHEVGSSEKRAGKYASMPISVGDGCWIGANALIMPGVTVEDGVIIAAGSVVTKDCESNCLYGGVLAKKIKELD